MRGFRGWLLEGQPHLSLRWRRDNRDTVHEPIDNLNDLLDEFDREGVLRVNSPDSEGIYTFVNKRATIYGTPVTVYWSNPDNYGSTVHFDHYPGACHELYGGQIAIHYPEIGPRGDVTHEARPFVATVLQFIQSGRPIYAHDCGDHMSISRGIGARR